MKSSNLKSFRDHLDEQYGKVGTKSRTEYEEGFEAFKLGYDASGFANQRRNDSGRVGQ
jgi:hypothetical protein